MADDKKDPWLNFLALATVVLAVCATLSSFRGSSYSTRAVINQNLASNQWAFYQSKSIKGYLYELQKETFDMDLIAQKGRLDSQQVNAFKRKMSEYDSTLARYDGEKSQIQKDARKYEEIRDDAQVHSRAFGMAVIFLQIAILLSSIAALLKKRLLWYVGLAVGAIGLAYFVYAAFILPVLPA